MSSTHAVQTPAPSAQRVFHPPEIWLIMQALGVMETAVNVPADAGFDARAATDARATLFRNGVLRADAQGVVQLTPAVEALVGPSVFPESVIVATVSDKGPEDQPARTLCFSRAGDSIVVNWVDARGDHHFVAYPAQDTSRCVLLHLLSACDLDVKTPDAGLPAPTPRDVERAAEQMKQAVALMALSVVGAPDQITRGAGWFVSGGTAWLMQPSPQNGKVVPRRASRADIAQAIVSLAEQTLA